jgi:hypothetical protein
MVTAYYLSHGHWTVIPHQLEEDFADMRVCGFDAVAMSFSESEMRYSRRAFEIQVRLAKKHGLKCLVIPSRLGGRFAGAPLMPSFWLAQNPDCLVPGNVGWPVAALEAPKFIEWIHGFLTTLIGDYDLDGIIWDEPKALRLISTHPATLAKCGPNPTVEQMQDGFVEFLTGLTQLCLKLKPGLVITHFAQKTDPEYYTRKAAGIPGIAYHGYDGNLARQSFWHEEPQWHKYRLESVWDRTVTECRAAGKQTFALVENMLMPAAAIPEYEANFAAYLQAYRPDHLSVYYYAHNNEDPERVHAITRRLMQKYL